MASDADTRRDALKIIGAIGLTCAYPFSADELYGQSEHHGAHGLVQLKQAVPETPRYFGENDWKLISRLADLIIPETDTPGAVTAGVPRYIDYVVGANDRHQILFRDGMQALRTLAREKFDKDFLELTEEQQIELLTPLSDAADRGTYSSAPERFFGALKSMTADGYFTSKIGLIQQLGYKGNAAVADFHGCTHEH